MDEFGGADLSLDGFVDSVTMRRREILFIGLCPRHRRCSRTFILLLMLKCGLSLVLFVVREVWPEGRL